jgi:single-stranded DNA-binding protein
MLYSPAEEVIFRGLPKITAFLIGNATHDAELKHTKESDTHYSDFRLAVRNRTGDTTFFPIRCFGKLAESVTAVTKGSKLFVEGELEITSFAGEEGGRRMTFRVVANTYRILGGGRRQETDEAEV